MPGGLGVHRDIAHRPAAPTTAEVAGRELLGDGILKAAPQVTLLHRLRRDGERHRVVGVVAIRRLLGAEKNLLADVDEVSHATNSLKAVTCVVGRSALDNIRGLFVTLSAKLL